MAEDSGQDRTEEPTGKRLDDARKKGQIARSQELSMTVVLVAGSAGLWLFGGKLAEAVFVIGRRLFSLSRDELFDEQIVGNQLLAALGQLLWPMAGWLAMVALAALVGGTILGGINFSSEAIGFKFSKLSPLAGFKRMFGPKGLVNLVKSIAKVLVIGFASYLLLRSTLDNILHLSSEGFPGNLIRAMDMVMLMVMVICAALILVAAIDVPYQLWEHQRQLKMTKQEVRDEHKESEGNPEVKGRIRRMQHQMSARRMMAEVPTADVVVVNPEHFSVALRYDAAKGAPRVVAKGSDELAMKIREIARANNVPIVSTPPLCRALYYSTKLDHEIPDGLFVAVAQVLAYVMQLKSWRTGKGRRPKPLAQELPIPNELRR